MIAAAPSPAQDIALLGTTRQRVYFVLALVILIVLPFRASPFLLDLANQVLFACIGALALMLLTGYAGQISLGTAGLLAAGAYSVGILVREVGAPFWITLPAAAVVGALLGLVFGLPSLRLRGLYLAISTLGLHFVVIYLGGEYEAREVLSTGVMIDLPSIGGFTVSSGIAWYFVLLVFAMLALLISVNLRRSRTGRAWRALRDRDVVASALGINVAALQTDGVRAERHHDGRRRCVVCLLPQLRLDRCLLAVSDRTVCRDDHHRRHGLDHGRAPRRGVRDPVSLRHRGGRRLPAGALQQHGLRAQLLDFRDRDDPVPAARARRPDGHCAPLEEHRVCATDPARMTEPLLAVDGLHVAYHRTAVALHGVSLRVLPQTIVALLGNNGAGKTTTLRAISGFIGLDDAQVTAGSIRFAGARIENTPPHANTARGIVIVPEREKVFPNLTVSENLTVVSSRRVSASDRKHLEDLVYQSFPPLANLRTRLAGLLSGGERQMLAIGSAIVCKPELSDG